MSDKSSNDIVVGILFLCSIITLIVGFFIRGYFSGSIASLQAGSNWILLSIWLMLLVNVIND